MPKNVNDILTAADAALAALREAVAGSLNKAEGPLAEARQAHADAVAADKAHADFLVKAEEAFTKGTTLAGEKKDLLSKAAFTEHNAFKAKAAERAEHAKLTHELVKAFFEDRADNQPLVKAEDADDWGALSGEVIAYHAAGAILHKNKAAEFRKAADKAKTDKDDESAAALTSAADASDAEGADADSMCKAAAWPPAETTLAKALEFEGLPPISGKADLLKAMESYKALPDSAKAAAKTHLFNAAAALKTTIPDGIVKWHEPINLDGGGNNTATFSTMSDADKAAALRKAALFFDVATFAALMANFAKSEDVPAAMKEWLAKGDALVGAALDTHMDMPEDITKAAPTKVEWASAAAKRVTASITDAMPEEQTKRRKALAAKLDTAHDFFTKSEKAAEDASAAADAARGELAKAEGERDAAQAKLTQVTTSLEPLVRSAMEQKELLTKADARNKELDERLKKLEAVPLPPKGKQGPATIINKSEDGGAVSRDSTSLRERIKSAPVGASRAEVLLDMAHGWRTALNAPT